jgi:hypothetical protein
MEWEQIIQQRRTTYRWSQEVPDLALIQAIVDEIHQYCPSKQQAVPFTIDIVDNYDPNAAPRAVELLIANKSQVQSKAMLWIALQKSRRIDPIVEPMGKLWRLKCRRDIGYMLAAIINDVRYDTNQYLRQYAGAYWKDGVPQVDQFEEVDTWTYIKGLLINEVLADPTELEPGVVEKVAGSIDTLISVIQTGHAALPALIPGLTRLRMLIWESTDRRLHDPQIDDIRNPQVLAPWLLVFSHRALLDHEIGIGSELRQPVARKAATNTEIGIASMWAVLSAEAKGLNSGFCACLQNGTEIAQLLGRNKPDEVPALIVGIGYRDTTPGTTYLNRLTYENSPTPDPQINKRPPKLQYVKYHINGNSFVPKNVTN